MIKNNKRAGIWQSSETQIARQIVAYKNLAISDLPDLTAIKDISSSNLMKLVPWAEDNTKLREYILIQVDNHGLDITIPDEALAIMHERGWLNDNTLREARLFLADIRAKKDVSVLVSLHAGGTTAVLESNGSPTKNDLTVYPYGNKY